MFQYYTKVEQAFKEKCVKFPITGDVKIMQEHEEQIVVKCFLTSLEPEYELARTQLLTNDALPSLRYRCPSPLGMQR